MQIQATSLTEIEALLRKCSYMTPMITQMQIEVPESFNSISPEDDRTIGTMLNTYWPTAIEPALLVTTEEEKMARADNIISSLLYSNIKEAKFLDFGCGQGHVAYRMAALGCELSVGYDTMEQWHDLPSHEKLVTTTDLTRVQSDAPYNAILIYDVLDHCDSPIEVLKIARDLLAPGGTIHLRCHPWCSRHGGHLYRYLNRAYAHFFLSKETCELLSEGQSPKHQTTIPLIAYSACIKAAGLTIVGTPYVIRGKVEPIFQNRYGAVIQKYWGQNLNGIEMMGIQFIDYKLKK